jgi:aminopeptidase N
MKLRISFLFAFLSMLLIVQAQNFTGSQGAALCARSRQMHPSLPDRSFRSQNTPLHTFDVLKYTINVDLTGPLTSPYLNSFPADVTVLFEADSALNEIVLDAVNTSLTIDSVTMACASWQHFTNNLSITLDRVYQPGEQAEIRIYYKHKSVSDGAFYASGGFAFTDCEPEGARKWFPCYDKPSDKALTDITATVPAGARIGSNGRLQDSVPDGNSIRYHWVSRDPVATYLTVLTASNNFLLDIVNWTNPNTNEVVPMRFYYNPGEDPSGAKNIISEMTSFYSQEFGDHPFEKNGFATLNDEFAWGGMENQTLTSLCPDCWSESLVAHEFAHQWFGDMVTCATWADIFLNEGFATWSEAHWTEHAYGYDAYKNELQGNAQYYLAANPGWAISVPSWAVTTPNVNTLFNYAITYMKGSCVLHMLRYTMGDDKFFPALKAYATDTVNFKYNTATIEDFKNKMELESGQELDWFFDQWVYKPNHPVYTNTYGVYAAAGGTWDVSFTVDQETQMFQPYFQMPVELQIRFDNLSDTLIRVFNSFPGQTFVFNFPYKPVQVIFDPNNEILLKEANTVVGMEEALVAANGLNLTISPNPVSEMLGLNFILNCPSRARLEIYDAMGRQCLTKEESFQNSGENLMSADVRKLPAGSYSAMLRAGTEVSSCRFVIVR